MIKIRINILTDQIKNLPKKNYNSELFISKRKIKFLLENIQKSTKQKNLKKSFYF